MPEVLKLTGTANPSLTVEFTDTITKIFDVWDTSEKIASLARGYANEDVNGNAILDSEGNPKPYVSIFDVVREACGFPTGDEAKVSGEFTPNQQVCQIIRAKLNEIVEELPETKKLSKMQQK